MLYPRALRVFLWVLGLWLWSAAVWAQQQPQREITRISGELYRFRNRGHFSVFLVTPAGVVVADPIDADAARWLKAEIAKRFAKPVKYLIYSHDHSDHISGGEVFADAHIDYWIESLRKAEALDYDILAAGHGQLGRKEDARAVRVYMEELREQVLKHVLDGKSIDEIKQLVAMEKYRGWDNYKNYLPLNIEGMARHRTLFDDAHP